MRIVPASLVLLTAFCAAPTCAQDAPAPRPQPHAVGGNPTIGTLPLQANIDSMMEFQVQRNDNGDGVTMDNQYQLNAQTYLIETNSGVTNVWSGDPIDDNFSTQSNSADTDSNPQTLITEVSTDVGIYITHTVSYVNGTQLLQHTWVVTNQNANLMTYTGVQLRYGGDISYLGLNQGVGVYDSTTNHLYVSVPSSPGLMSYYADPSSPFSHVYEDDDVEGALNSSAASLPDTVNSTYQDSAGMGVEWDIGTLAPNQTKTIIMYEEWDTPGYVTVTPPGQTTEATGVADNNLVFTIQNNEATADTFNLDVNGGPGMSTVLAPSVTVPALGNATVKLTLTAQAAGIPESSVSVLATSTNNPAYFSQGMMLIEQPACSLTAPPAMQVPPATQVSAPLSIANLEAFGDSFIVNVTASSGVTLTTATLPGLQPEAHHPLTRYTVPIGEGVQMYLAEGASSPFSIQFSVAADATLPATMTVTAESQNATSPVLTTVTIPLTIQGPGVNPGTVTLPAPGIGVSTDGNVVFYPLCPSTTAGIGALEAFLDANVPTDAVGFTWDASTQSYVEYPNQPTGGIQTTTGLFVATAVPFDVDFSGAPSATAASLTLDPGWNLLGVPPISSGGATVTAVSFPADFSLVVGGVSVTSAAVFADDIGTPTSDQPLTASPYYFNGSGYTQVTTLNAGTAYWFHNNLASPATLTVNPAVLVQLFGAHGQSRTAAGSSPPPAPTTSPTASDTAAKSGRCGAAAGVVMLVSMALWWRRRRS